MSDQSAADGQPNVLIILCDQLQRDFVGVYGHPLALTPHVDRLAAEGVKLARAYVPKPQCAPSRASMFTGRYPHQHRLMMNGAWHTWQTPAGPLANRPALPESVPSLGQAFQAAGYRLGYTGPWHMGNDETPQHGWTDFWRTYRYWKDGRDFYVQYLEELGLDEVFHTEHQRANMARSARTDQGQPSMATQIPTEHTRTAWAVSQALEFLDSGDARPWLFCCSIKDPHPPVLPPPEFADLVSPNDIQFVPSWVDDLEDKPAQQRDSASVRWTSYMSDDQWRQYIAHYHGLNAHIDTEVGRLLRGLDQRGLADDTLVIFLSDHGEMMGSHHMAHKGPYMYEDVYAIPFIAHWPGRIEGGRTESGFFSTVDFTATIGALCGVPVDGGAGLDQSAMLAHGQPGPRDAIFAEFYGQGSEAERGLMAIKSVRTDRWKYNVYLNDRSELYDLAADPHELTNLIDNPEHADTRSQLGDRIVGWLRDTDDPLADTFAREIAKLASSGTVGT